VLLLRHGADPFLTAKEVNNFDGSGDTAESLAKKRQGASKTQQQKGINLSDRYGQLLSESELPAMLAKKRNDAVVDAEINFLVEAASVFFPQCSHGVHASGAGAARPKGNPPSSLADLRAALDAVPSFAADGGGHIAHDDPELVALRDLLAQKQIEEAKKSRGKAQKLQY